MANRNNIIRDEPDHDFAVNTCCRDDRYGDVWLTTNSLNIGPSPAHGCHVVIDTVEDAEKLIAAAQAFIAQKAP